MDGKPLTRDSERVPVVVEIFQVTAHRTLEQLNNRFRVEDYELAAGEACHGGREGCRMVVIVSVYGGRVEGEIQEILNISGVNAVWTNRRTK
jgi:hypothetical protein